MSFWRVFLRVGARKRSSGKESALQIRFESLPSFGMRYLESPKRRFMPFLIRSPSIKGVVTRRDYCQNATFIHFGLQFTRHRMNTLAISERNGHARKEKFGRRRLLIQVYLSCKSSKKEVQNTVQHSVGCNKKLPGDQLFVAVVCKILGHQPTREHVNRGTRRNQPPAHS